MRISILLVLLLAAGFIQAQVSDFGKQTPFLLENKGQVSNSDGTAAEQVLYYMNTPKMDFYLTKQGVTYVFKKGILSDVEPGDEQKPAEVKEVQWHRVDVTPLNGQMNLSDVELTYAKQGTVSIFNQLVPKGLEHMRPVETVTFRNVYPGIDWQFVVEDDYLKYNFILHEGADMSQIQLRFDGQDNIQIKDNRLLVETSLGSLAENEIVSFTSSKKTVDVQAKLNNNILTYECNALPQLANGETLTIDPPLVWATYFGGSLDDYAVVMERNSNGFIYVLTQTTSTDFPVLSESAFAYYQGTFVGNKDIGILKFTENGVQVWTTYYGGTGVETPSNLFYNGTILMIVGSTSSSDFPTMNPGLGAFFDNTLGGALDGFVIAFSIADVRVWSTYIGGSTAGSISADDAVNDCTFKNNRLIITGYAKSTDFPILANGSSYFDNTHVGCDVFITEFTGLFNITWSTLLGNDGTSLDPYCDIDSLGRLCVTYSTTSTNIPLVNTLPGSYSQAWAGGVDYGITLFDAGRQIIWHTYYGGPADDWGQDIICDYNNGWILTGLTKSVTFPVVNNIGAGFYQSTKGEAITNSDAAILKFDANGVRQYATFYGGNGNDVAYGLTLDSHKNLYIVGETKAANLPVYNPLDGSYFDGQLNLAGSTTYFDEFLMELDSNYNMKWATYLGGNTQSERLMDVRVSPSDHVFAVGYTYSSDHPTVNPGLGAYFDNARGGTRDAVIMKFIPCPENFDTIWAPDSVCYGETIDIYATGSHTYTWNTGSTNDSIQAVIVSDTSFSVIATYLTCIERDTVFIKVKPLPVITFAGDSTVCMNDSMHLSASGGVAYAWENGFSTDSISFLPAASDFISVTVTNSYGCVATDSIQTTVYPLPVPVISGDNTPCLLDTTTLSASGGVSYVWSNAATTSTIDLAWNSTGTFNYYAIATDVNGCADTAFFTATVTNLPEFWLGNDTIICNLTTITLDPGIAGAGYLWSTGAATPTLDVSTANTYWLDLNDANNCHFRDTINVTVQALPVITFGGADTTCFGSPITMSATAPTGVSYAWSNGMNTSTITFTPTASGLDTIAVTVTDALTCTKTDSLEFMVYALPVPSISGDNTPCMNDVVTLTASGGVSYIWSNSATSAAISIPFNSMGTFNYYSIATDIHGCKDTAFFTASVLPLPVFDFGPDTTICAATSFTLSPGITGAAYDWSTGATSQTIVVGSADEYFLEITGANGCVYEDSITVAVQPYPTITFGGDTTVCFSHPITITATGGTTYAWENSMSGSSITFVPAASDTLTVLVTDIYGCSSTDSVGFDVLPLPVPGITGSAEICQFDTTTLTASGGVSYQWSSGQPTVSADIYSTVAGLYTYYVIATAPNGCTDTAFHQLTVHAVPAINLGADTIICEGTSLLLDAANSGATYNWSTSATSQTISVNTAGTYLVTVTDAFLCHNTDSIVVATQPYADATIVDVAFICQNGAPFDCMAAQAGGSWSGDGITNATNGTFNPATAGSGNATIVYTIAGQCGDTDSSTIEVGALPQIAFTATDETCPDLNDGMLMLEISGGTAPYISELDTMFIGDTTLNLSPGAYLLTVTDFRGCASTDSVTILAEETPCGEVDFYIPNIFSPNGDLQNDVLYVRSDFIESMSWYMYDRFGEKVFESKDINLGWDGEYQGQPVQSGVYYWYIKATFIDGSTIEKEGNVTVVR